MSDSNQDIKNRLSETVRDNAKHLLDPHRKVNGEPVPAQQPQLFTGGVMRWYQIEGIEWLRVSTPLLSDSFLHFAVLLCYFLAKLDPWTFLKGKNVIESFAVVGRFPFKPVNNPSRVLCDCRCCGKMASMEFWLMRWAWERPSSASLTSP